MSCTVYFFFFSNTVSPAHIFTVAFKVYDMDRDGLISNGELFLVLKMMVGNNLKDQQLQQIVDKTIMEADKNGDGKLDFEEFQEMVANTDVAKQLTLEVCLSPLSPLCPSLSPVQLDLTCLFPHFPPGPILI